MTLVAPAATLGTTSVNGSQNVVYNSTGATGTDPVGYQCSDGAFTRQGTVTVTVAAEILPVAPDASLPISTLGAAPGPGTTGSVNITGLGGYVGGNAPSAISLVAPLATKGTATVIGGTTISYTPNSTFFAGTDQINYRITDSDGDTDDGLITVIIANVAPLLADGSDHDEPGYGEHPVSLVITPGNGSVAQSPVTVTTAAANGTCAVTGTAAAPTLTYTPGRRLLRHRQLRADHHRR